MILALLGIGAGLALVIVGMAYWLIAPFRIELLRMYEQ